MPNYDQHESIIKVSLDQHYIFNVDGVDFNVTCTNELDQLACELPQDGLELYTGDPRTCKITSTKAYQNKQLSQKYILLVSEHSSKGKQINKLLEEIGENDLFFLLGDYMKTLESLYSLYKEQAQESINLKKRKMSEPFVKAK